MKHIDGIIIKSSPPNWILTIEVNEGKEALGVSYPHPNDYDHVIFCSAGNGIWKPKDKPAWRRLAKNIDSLDPAKVVVVLVGSDEIWRRKLDATPPNEVFYVEIKKHLEQKRIRFAQITDFMENIKYADCHGHPAQEDHDRLAEKLLKSFQDIIRRPRRGGLRSRRPDVEAVRCEEACDAGAAATQQRPRRSDAGAATRSPRASGSRVDVLVAANAYPGWEQDLLNEHSVILNQKTDKKKQSFQCQICNEYLPNWAHVPGHCKGEKHKKAAQQKKTAGDTRLGASFVPASEPECDEDWAQMKFYAQHDMLTDLDAKLVAGVDPNATEPGDDRTPLFWAAWCGKARIVTRLLVYESARERASTNCIGRDGIPVEPASPLAVANKCGDDSDVFAAFGNLLSSQAEREAHAAALEEGSTCSSRA